MSHRHSCGRSKTDNCHNWFKRRHQQRVSSVSAPDKDAAIQCDSVLTSGN